MNSPSTHFVSSRRLGLYEPIHHHHHQHQMMMMINSSNSSTWGDFKGNGCPVDASPSGIIIHMDTKLENQSEDTLLNGNLGPSSNKYEQEAAHKPPEKVLRRLAQNREAARKSRLRKKAYVQQLETSRLKLMRLEQELERIRHQGVYGGCGLDASPLGYSGTINSGISAFEIEYGQWVEEQNQQIVELRTALHSSATDLELGILVESCMSHYFDLFRMKAAAAKADVFYLMSGMWKTTAERFFHWIGGFRPSDLLKVRDSISRDLISHGLALDVLEPSDKFVIEMQEGLGLMVLAQQIETLADHQLFDIGNLRQSCQQAEDALTQGMEKLQQTLAETVAAGHLGEGSYMPRMATAMERLGALVNFVNQADHLRQETLQQMYRILSIRQAAQGLLALGAYFQQLRALSVLWETRSREPA